MDFKKHCILSSQENYTVPVNRIACVELAKRCNQQCSFCPVSGCPTIQNRPKKKDGWGSKSKKKGIFLRQKQLWDGLVNTKNVMKTIVREKVDMDIREFESILKK